MIFTGITRLPLAAGWDCLVPAWFTRLHPVHRTPVNSILAMAVLVMALIGLSMWGVREQEASQLLVIGSVAHYAIAYAALFAIPLSGAIPLPRWLKPVALVGMLSSVLSLCVIVYPVVDVVNKWAYAARIIGVVAVANVAGAGIYWANSRRVFQRGG
jgi:amino acid transporter